jgi:hypothetical protein
MTRVLIFDGPTAAKRFELCHRAVLGFGNGKDERTREVIRKEARILDALDAISEPDREAVKAGDKDARQLQAAGGTVTLAQDDFALLEKDVETTPWLPRVARDVVDVQDWLSACEKVNA